MVYERGKVSGQLVLLKMYPSQLTTTQVEQMPFVKKVITYYLPQGWKMYTWIFYIILKSTIIACQSIFIYNVRNDFSLFSLAAVTYFVPMMGLCKAATIIIFRREINAMYSIMKEKFLDLNIVRPELRNRVKIVNLMMVALFWTCLILCFVIVMLPLGKYPDGKRPLPAVVWLPFNTDQSPLHEIVYFILGLSHHWTIVNHIINDFMFVYFTQNLALQFIVLKELLRNVCEVSNVNDADKYESAEYQEIINVRLKDCVNHHILLVKFFKDIQRVFSFGLLLQFLATIPLLVFTGFLLENDHSDIIKTGKLLIYAMVLTTQVMLFAFNGSELEYESATLATAAYNSRWYFGKKPFRKGLNIFQMNAQGPLKITGMGLVYVNNPIIATIYRTVGSVLTLIQKLVN